VDSPLRAHCLLLPLPFPPRRQSPADLLRESLPPIRSTDSRDLAPTSLGGVGGRAPRRPGRRLVTCANIANDRETQLLCVREVEYAGPRSRATTEVESSSIAKMRLRSVLSNKKIVCVCIYAKTDRSVKKKQTTNRDRMSTLSADDIRVCKRVVYEYTYTVKSTFLVPLDAETDELDFTFNDGDTMLHYSAGAMIHGVLMPRVDLWDDDDEYRPHDKWCETDEEVDEDDAKLDDEMFKSFADDIADMEKWSKKRVRAGKKRKSMDAETKYGDELIGWYEQNMAPQV